MLRQRRFHRSPLAGFTLVELLAVIAIIALLIGILVPSISAIKTKAREVATRAAIASIGTGIESFRAENRLGGGYPPSATDAGGNPVDEYKARSPYSELPNGISNDIRMSGAGLLVWALWGADLLGTPGFRTFNTDETEWAADTRARPGSGGAYELDADTLQPKRARFGPYVDDGVRVTQFSKDFESFEIPAETDALDSLGRNPRSDVQRDYPMYLDAFGFPLLYYRADPAGIAMYDNDPHNLNQPQDRGFYHWTHNENLFRGTNQLVLASHGLDHNLDSAYKPPPSAGNDPNPITEQFAYFLWNSAVSARHMPKNAKTYLLFSPGPDGRYGTSDDIGNFKNAGE